MVKVVVEYCGSWGYAPRYRELASLIKEAVPDAEVTGVVGRRSSFEVTVDDVVIHTKLGTMKFPNFEEVVDIVKSTADGEKPSQVQKGEKECTIL